MKSKKTELSPIGTAEELQKGIQRLAQEAESTNLPARVRKKLEENIRDMVAELGQLLGSLDPIRQPTALFDPSNPKIIGRFVALALVAQQRSPMCEIPRFYGSGVYAIYYKGTFPLYKALSESETPMYVGRAAPKSNHARTAYEQGAKLCDRLKQHVGNIQEASHLDLKDFDYRALVVQSGWEKAAEDYLIHLFRPIWNSETGILYGIGKHGDSHTTRANKRSPWDTIHAGRKWAIGTLEDAKSPETIREQVANHFAAHRVFESVEAVLTSFIDELRQA